MPIYEYQNERTGTFEEMFRPIKMRDKVARHLRRVMSRTSYRIGEGKPDPTSADVAAPRGLKEMENQMGTSRLEHELGMSTKQLRKIWNT